MDDLFDLESFGVGLLGEADSRGGSGLLDEAVRVARATKTPIHLLHILPAERASEGS